MECAVYQMRQKKPDAASTEDVDLGCMPVALIPLVDVRSPTQARHNFWCLIEPQKSTAMVGAIIQGFLRDLSAGTASGSPQWVYEYEGSAGYAATAD